VFKSRRVTLARLSTMRSGPSRRRAAIIRLHAVVGHRSLLCPTMWLKDLDLHDKGTCSSLTCLFGGDDRFPLIPSTYVHTSRTIADMELPMVRCMVIDWSLQFQHMLMV
jgi:hypothetical protein